MSLQDILAKLSPDERKQVEALANAASKGKRGFVHVGFSPVYRKDNAADGSQRSTATNIDDPNKLRIAQNRLLGKRNVSIGVNRQRDGSYTVNALAAPAAGVIWTKDGRLAIVLSDTYTDAEKQTINTWAKSKYTAPPDVTTSTAPAPAEASQEASEESSEATETPAEAPKTPSGNNAQVLKDAKEMVAAGMYTSIPLAIAAHNKGDW